MGQHRIQVAQDSGRGDPEDGEALLSEHRIASQVAPGLIPAIVSFTIDLDDHPLFKANEVDRCWTYGELAPELLSVRPSP